MQVFSKTSIVGLLLVLGLMRASTALGINCRGSSQCSPWYNTVDTDDLISQFNSSIWTSIRDDDRFFKSLHIACAKNADWAVGGICLFLQGNVPLQGIPGAILKYKIGRLVYHGCRYCGSVPISTDDDPGKAGYLTSNYVKRPQCDGLCGPGETFFTTAVTPTQTSLRYSSLQQGVLFTARPASVDAILGRVSQTLNTIQPTGTSAP